jgi:hypothetical protein
MEQDKLHDSVTRCRQAYGVFQQSTSRTDEALYQALAEVYSLDCQFRVDAALRAKFDQLLELRSGRKQSNEALFLIKYAFFPDTLQPGPGHKSDINKASRYAKLINKALTQNIRPDAFVAFARDQGVQRTALASRPGKRPPVAKAAPRRREASTLGPSALGEATILMAAVSALECWFYSTSVAEQSAGAVQRAKSQPQKITVTMYVNNERAVVTGLTTHAWYGKFPEGAFHVRGAPPVALQPPANAKTTPLPSQPRNSPPRLRNGMAPPMQPRTRSWQRRADGYVWPSWRPFPRG